MLWTYRLQVEDGVAGVGAAAVVHVHLELEVLQGEQGGMKYKNN